MAGDGDENSGGAGYGFWKCGLEKEMEGPIAGVRVVDAPILLLVYFHKALRGELAELHRVCLSWLENGCTGGSDDVIVDLIRRFRFLKLVCKYHCATEDEVIFHALDQRVANIACSYSLEHGDIDDLFVSVFQNLDILLNGDDKLSSFQRLVLSTGTIKMSICQHMLKEEEQLFPLLMQRFSFEEQASLVWQFICSVPVVLLEDFLPWMTSYLSADEKVDLMNCIKLVVPKEKLLQEVVISWLDKRSKISWRVSSTRGNVKLSSGHVEPPNFKDLQKNYSSWMSLHGENFCLAGSFCHHENGVHHPVDGLLIWHNAIKKDFNEILEELHKIRSSSIFSSLALIGEQLKFLADVVIFYSDALEKVFFSFLNEISNGCLSFSHQRFPEEDQIGGLLSVLQNINSEKETSLCKHVETLCWQLESFIVEMIKHFSFQESKVLPLIHNHCAHEMQLQLLYTSLHMMPLGLLKCVITWLSARLTEDELKVVFWSIKLAGSEDDTCFASLLHEWVRVGYSGKTSMEKFREELQGTFRNSGAFLSEQINKNTGPSFESNVWHCQTSHICQIKPKSVDNFETTVYNSSSEVTKEKHRTLYSSGINLHIYFPEVLKKLSPFAKYLSKKVDAGSSLKPELKPIDHIFLFHKALRNDLEYLVRVSAKMTENVGLVKDFLQRFHILQFLYQIHSENEDEIAFPALEAKGKLQNISHSYTVDHKLESEYFHRISSILNEILELKVFIPSEQSPHMDATHGQIMIKYHKLCLKLHHMSKTMCVMLVKHFHREEIELWPLFSECFSHEEQERIIGCVLGRTRAEVLREMIPWLMASLSTGEQNALLSLWLKATKNTMFDKWLSEWWVDMNKRDEAVVEEELTVLPSRTADPLEIVFTYLSEEACNESKGRTHHEKGFIFPRVKSVACNLESNGKVNEDNHAEALNRDLGSNQSLEVSKQPSAERQQGINKVLDFEDQVDKHDQLFPSIKKSKQQEELVLTLSQEGLEDAVRRVSRDATLDTQKKSFIIQNLLMSRWLATQQKPHWEAVTSNDNGEIPGRFPSYRDTLSQTLGCEHYKRKCKLFADCCKKLFTCRYCHDDAADHLLDLKSTTKMMCMLCLKVQPIGPTCSNISCNNLSMAKYFCAICRLYDDEREIYHCPYCNLCRVGKGLGVDYFHCMNCNACMSKSLSLHVCREKCFESNCPICHEDIFTSCSPVKALPCGHMMHSTCFQDYTCTHYTCPICSKSLGDMQLYFGMLDVLLAEEKVPQEYQGKTQMILCNDCEKKGDAPFHWLYHKCSHCGSYNSRPI